MAKRRGGLGRGLDALFADAEPVFEEPAEETEETEKPEKTGTVNNKNAENAAAEGSSDEDRVVYIDINEIKPNRDQPRKTFKEERIKELADSIRENGVIQPLIVRKADNGYELVAGERRWRAARVAGLRKVPCIIRDFDEKQNMIVAIIENMQREDLDAIEEAMGLNAMIKKFGFTQEQVSTSLGKSRAYIANSLRLLKLPEDIQKMISDGKISAAHGRTIINVGDEKKQHEICDKIVKQGLSVRATERLAEKAKDDARPPRKRRRTKRDAEIAAVEDELRRLTGTKVSIVSEGSHGKIELEYYSRDELNRLIELLRAAGESEI
jgi:ParB family chromosome partitioning protein